MCVFVLNFPESTQLALGFEIVPTCRTVERVSCTQHSLHPLRWRGAGVGHGKRIWATANGWWKVGWFDFSSCTVTITKIALKWDSPGTFLCCKIRCISSEELARDRENLGEGKHLSHLNHKAKILIWVCFVRFILYTNGMQSWFVCIRWGSFFCDFRLRTMVLNSEQLQTSSWYWRHKSRSTATWKGKDEHEIVL